MAEHRPHILVFGVWRGLALASGGCDVYCIHLPFPPFGFGIIGRKLEKNSKSFYHQRLEATQRTHYVKQKIEFFYDC
jgi:hypothetical protein